MLYKLLYYVVNVLIRLFYRRMHITGLDNIDPKKTYLITSNHPNGFFEPLIMACTFPIDLHFMVRGDLFENPILNWFLRSTHQIPIFRFVDGYAKLKANRSSMGEATKKLNEGNSILVFVEGGTKAVMKCRGVMKGAAKMAFQTFDEYPDKELHILPVGINFSDWRNPGGEVIVNVGKSFDARPFYDDNLDAKAKGVLGLTRAIEVEMKKEIIEVNDKSHEHIIRKLWDLLTVLNPIIGRLSNDKMIFDPLKGLGSRLNEGHIDLIGDVDKLHMMIAPKNKSLFRIMGVKKSWLQLLFPIAIPAIIFYLVPVTVAYYMRKKLVRKDAFAAPIFGIPAYVISVIFHVSLFVILGLKIGFVLALAINIGLMISGWCALFIWENHHKVPSRKIDSKLVEGMNTLIQKIK